MAIGCISSEAVGASLKKASPHSFHGSSAAELLKRPPSLLKCPFLRAFLGLKATFQSATSHIEANSAKSTPLSLSMAADLAQGRSADEVTSLTDSKTEILAELEKAEMPGVPPDSGVLQSRYANRKRTIMVIGLSVHSSAVEMREKLAIPEADWAHAIEELTAHPHIEEAGILSTCNRLEVYVSALSWHMGMMEVLDWMSQKSGAAQAELREHLFVLQNQDASKHLFKVASGLVSLVLGEGQILSQVKHVMQMGQGAEGFGRHLTGLFKQAIVAGKRVRNETAIGRGSVSVSSAAVELAAKKLPDVNLKDASTCIVGAGKMASLMIKHLIGKSCTSIVVVNRSEERVLELQRTFPNVRLTYHPLCELASCIMDAHVVFTCTASDTPLIDKSTVEALLSGDETKVFVDISVPRNVSACVAQLGKAVVYNVDDLQEVVAGNKEERSKKALEAHAIIEEELKCFEAWQDSLETVPTIKKLRAYAEGIRVSELEKCLEKMGENLSAKDKKLIEELSRTIVNKLLNGPMVHLRNDGSGSSCRAEILENMHALERMFGLNLETLPLGRKANSSVSQVR
ncbi:hypothetical protein L7F22_010623 [Adiantum nelumboides]|nr:hypothetical protein [Adiantum nelumboides]